MASRYAKSTDDVEPVTVEETEVQEEEEENNDPKTVAELFQWIKENVPGV